MRVVIHGASGRMGRVLCRMLEEGYEGMSLAAQVSPSCAEGGAPDCYSSLANFTGEADCVVDFSIHSATKTLLDYCLSRRLPVVIATTGHTAEEMDMIRAAAEEIPVFFSANMSVGVALVADLARRAAAMFPAADIEIIEKHHNRKLDVPSGTALLLADSIRKARTDAEYVIGRHENGRRKAGEIGIHAVRLGNEVGTHEIIIATGNETVTIKHEAEDRSLFAGGALTAAAFLQGKAPGYYTMQDILAK